MTVESTGLPHVLADDPYPGIEMSTVLMLDYKLLFLKNFVLRPNSRARHGFDFV